MPAKPSDKYIPLYFVAFFTVVFAVNGVFVYKAVSTHTGVVTEDAYEKGLAYNKVIAAVDAQEALGLTSKIEVLGNDIIYSLTDKNGKLVKADVSARLIRPNQSGYDYDVKLQAEDGQYKAEANFPLKGLWRIEVLAKWDGQTYQQSKRVVVQ